MRDTNHNPSEEDSQRRIGDDDSMTVTERWSPLRAVDFSRTASIIKDLLAVSARRSVISCNAEAPCLAGGPDHSLKYLPIQIFPPAACVRALRIASGLFMMFMKLFFPIMDRSGKLMAMRNRAYSA